MAQMYMLPGKLRRKNRLQFAAGTGLTMLLAAAAYGLARLPLVSMMGSLVMAILLGMLWKAALPVAQPMKEGITFSGRTLLRAGIILLGMRLNLAELAAAGPRVFAIAVIHVAVTLFAVYGMSRLLGMDRRLGMLTACGTAICGAAAVAAAAPQVRASEEETAVGAAAAAILGTGFTLLYTAVYPVLQLTPRGFGIFSGATLHEVAHVLAAAAPLGQEAVELAVMVKLTRVALLVPVVVGIGIWAGRRDSQERKAQGAGAEKYGLLAAKDDIREWKARKAGPEENGQHAAKPALPVPWFILGFVAMSAINTLGILPDELVERGVQGAYLLIGMAMAGLGLSVDLSALRRLGGGALKAGFAGSILLSVMGWLLIRWFGLG